MALLFTGMLLHSCTIQARLSMGAQCQTKSQEERTRQTGRENENSGIQNHHLLIWWGQNASIFSNNLKRLIANGMSHSFSNNYDEQNVNLRCKLTESDEVAFNFPFIDEQRHKYGNFAVQLKSKNFSGEKCLQIVYTKWKKTISDTHLFIYSSVYVWQRATTKTS